MAPDVQIRPMMPETTTTIRQGTQDEYDNSSMNTCFLTKRVFLHEFWYNFTIVGADQHITDLFNYLLRFEI